MRDPASIGRSPVRRAEWGPVNFGAMSAPREDVSSGLLTADVDVSTQRRIVRRAGQLCLGAEPHTDQSPCAAHVVEARRQLLGLPV